jgi:hypothetical protein
MARPEGLEPPTLCLEGAVGGNPNALSSVAYGCKTSDALPLSWAIGLQGYKNCLGVADGTVVLLILLRLAARNDSGEPFTSST